MINRIHTLLLTALCLFADDAADQEDRKIPVGGQAVIEGVQKTRRRYF